jgi:alpha-N-acetylglucosaminidase
MRARIAKQPGGRKPAILRIALAGVCVALLLFFNIFFPSKSGEFYLDKPPAAGVVPSSTHDIPHPPPTKPTVLDLSGVYQLAGRRVPLADISQIEFAFKESKREFFSYQVLNSTRVVISGSSLSSLSRGLGAFYRTVCKTELLSWADASRPTQSCFPTPNIAVFKSRAKFPIRYGWNAVTFSYSSTYWSFARYAQEIDWLALQGVNLWLAHEGQEFVFRKVFLEICQIDAATSGYFTHEAYFAWNRMGNIRAVGGLPSLEYITSRHELQLQILRRIKSLGIMPVLPAFNGFAPCGTPELKFWAGFSAEDSSVPKLSPRSDLFQRIAARVVEIQLGTYAEFLPRDQPLYFDTDAFNENPVGVEEEENFKGLADALVGPPRAVAALHGYSRVVIVMQMWFLANEWKYWTRGTF